MCLCSANFTQSFAFQPINATLRQTQIIQKQTQRFAKFLILLKNRTLYLLLCFAQDVCSTELLQRWTQSTFCTHIYVAYYTRVTLKEDFAFQSINSTLQQTQIIQKTNATFYKIFDVVEKSHFAPLALFCTRRILNRTFATSYQKLIAHIFPLPTTPE